MKTLIWGMARARRATESSTRSNTSAIGMATRTPSSMAMAQVWAPVSDRSAGQPAPTGYATNELARTRMIARWRPIARNRRPARTEKNGSIAVEACSCVGLKTEPSERPSWIEMTRPANSTAWNESDRMNPSERPMTSSIGAASTSGRVPAVPPAGTASATVRAAARPNLSSVGMAWWPKSGAAKTSPVQRIMTRKRSALWPPLSSTVIARPARRRGRRTA